MRLMSCVCLFNNPVYREHMEKSSDERGLHQQIMIGYSDSSKDGGYLASNWNLYQAQDKLTTTCADEGILLELFHGRGGSIGRGGGPTNRAIRSQPPLSLKGGIKITEQGEVIAYRYSNADIAYRHLQQVMSAALYSRLVKKSILILSLNGLLRWMLSPKQGAKPIVILSMNMMDFYPTGKPQPQSLNYRNYGFHHVLQNVPAKADLQQCVRFLGSSLGCKVG